MSLGQEILDRIALARADGYATSSGGLAQVYASALEDIAVLVVNAGEGIMPPYTAPPAQPVPLMPPLRFPGG